MNVIPPAISHQSILCRLGETVRLYASDQNNFLCVPDLQHCISIGFIGKNNHKSLSACPCLVFFSQTGRVKFFADEYLAALIKRETVWLGGVESVEIKASYKNPKSAWYLCYVENFFEELGFKIFADFSPSDKHILGHEDLVEYEDHPYHTDIEDNLIFAEFLLKFLILGVDHCLPVIKYDKQWINAYPPPVSFLEKLNLSYLLSAKVLNQFLKKYNLEDDEQIVAAMIKRNFTVFMHNFLRHPLVSIDHLPAYSIAYKSSTFPRDVGSQGENRDSPPPAPERVLFRATAAERRI